MQSRRELRCVIAAGGTAGHVLPSLAVAEALRARGVLVSFAGSPDRIEARLVPEAGFEFDAFRVAGLPRRPGLALVRALLTDAEVVRDSAAVMGAADPLIVGTELESGRLGCLLDRVEGGEQGRGVHAIARRVAGVTSALRLR